MKLQILFGCLVTTLFSTQVHAQGAPIKQKSYPIFNTDERIDIKKTTDGGLVMCDYNYYLYGNSDYHVIKTDSLGSAQKIITLGGSGDDQTFSVSPTRDGGYIVGGISNSGISGNKTAASFGQFDYWVIKLNNKGDVQWDKTIGSSGNEFSLALDTALDGGYIIGGSTNGGASGEKTSAIPGMWIVKIDSLGTIQWDKTIGGNSEDYFEKIKYTSDGGYIVGGNSSSHHYGEYGQDYRVVKLDGNGNTVWDKLLGTSDPYDNLYSIIETTDGGYLAGGSSEGGISGDKTEVSHGSSDFWLIKLAADGTKLWDKTIGGNDIEDLANVQNTMDGGYAVGGFSWSNISFNKTENSRGYGDYWMVKLNSLGQEQWDKTIGGSGEDEANIVVEYKKDEYVLGGWSWSGISGDRTIARKGSEDLWVTYFTYGAGSQSSLTSNRITTTKMSSVAGNNFMVYPNPAKDMIHIQGNTNAVYTLSDAAGKIELSKNINGNGTLNASRLPAGIYYLQNTTLHTSVKVMVTH